MPIHYKITIRIIFVSVIEKRYVNKTRSGGTFWKWANYKSKGEISILMRDSEILYNMTLNDTFADCPLPESIYEPGILKQISTR